MSSILDALKKLESEKEDQPQPQDLDWPHQVDTKGALYHSLSRKRPYKAVVLGVCALAAVSLGVWFALTHGPQTKPERPVAEKADPGKPASAPEKRVSSQVSAPEKAVADSRHLQEKADPRPVFEPQGMTQGAVNRTERRRPRPIYDPEAMMPIPVHKPKRDEPRAAQATEGGHNPWGDNSANRPADPMFGDTRSNSTSTRRLERDPRTPPSHGVGQTEQRAETAARVFDESEIAALTEIMPGNIPKEQPDLKAMWDARIQEHERKAQASMPVKTEESVAEADGLDEEMEELLARVPKEMLPPQKVVEGGWLKLHAISWSDDPERRIAVINAKLVKEGRRIEGALISRIERDYVVIEKNGEEMMLPFGNH